MTRWRCTSTTSPRSRPTSPGTAALSVPSGLADDGLPVGLQIMAPALGEAVMYRAAAAYEASRPTPTAPEVLLP